MKHNLKEAIEILDTEVAFLPLYLHEWKKELEQLKQKLNQTSGSQFQNTFEYGQLKIIDEVLGTTT